MSETSPHFHLHLVPRGPTVDRADAGFELFKLQAKAKAGEVCPVTDASIAAVCATVKGELEAVPDEDKFRYL